MLQNAVSNGVTVNSVNIMVFDCYIAGEGVVNMGQAAINTHTQLAKANSMNFLSIWAIQRDNGGCPGDRGDNLCSGIAQNPWDFSHALEPFTG